MKKFLFRIILSVFFLQFINISCFSQNPTFEVSLSSIPLGNVYQGDAVNFTFDVKNQFFNSYETYSVSIPSPNIASGIVSTITPNEFNLEYMSDIVEITVVGQIPIDFEIGEFTFFIEVINVNDPNIWQDVWVTYNVLPSGGFEDNIAITDGSNSFSVGDFIGYEAHFYDEEPTGDEIEEWNLKTTLFNSQGEYTYVDLTNSWGPISSYWTYIAPATPQNLIFRRNAQGQIFGQVTVTGFDTDGYSHVDNLDIGINKEPDKPILYPQQFNNSSVKLIYNSLGANDYYIYYDTDPNPPYNGTGLIQGNSPIHVGIQTQFEIEGLQNCTPYYFAIKAGNSDGLSVFSDEVNITVFEPSNYQSVNVNLFDFVIPEDTQIDENFYFGGNLIIESGATVELNGGIMYFDENSKIIIEPGGKLTLDGATCAGVCGQTWAGIEVWGNYSQHQYTINGQNAQGQLILMNDAVIENAVSAVELWKPNDYTKTGGIVQATDAFFRNNTKSIHAISYTNFNPFIPGRETDNVSYFNNCVFELDEDYIPGHTFYKHADLDRVKGIKFRGCDFTVTPVEGVSYWNSAIASYSAGFGVEAICTSNTIPCSEYDKCTFTGFNSAIHATASPSNTRTFSVSRAVFTDNIYGVQVETVNNFSVLFSDFFIGHNAIDEDECEGTDLTAAGYGISSSNSTGFAIEENYFTKVQGAPAGNYVGIRITETNAVDEIYNNQFEGLSYGVYAEGKNWRVTNYYEGLSLLCNDFTDSYRDIVVAQNPTFQGGIQSSQGNTLQPAGNEFVANTGDYKIYNNGNYPILYYYDVNSNSANPNPSYEIGPISTGNTNNCRSHYGGGGVGEIETIVLSNEEKLVVEQEYLTALNNYNDVKTLYDDLKDGGDTEELKAEVETAWPDDTWELRAVLLGKSPHLSTEVLKAAADKTEVLPESILFEILAANPDELRKEELIKYLEDKENPLPQYMINILRQVAYGTTYKTALQDQMSENTRLKTRASNDMIRSILNKEETDYDILRNWLDNLGGLKADLQIIETYLTEGNLDDAVALAGMIPQLYKLGDYDLVEHAYYMEMLDLWVDLLQQGRNYDDFTDVEVTQLVNLAQNSQGTAGEQARSILEQGYGYHFCNCLNISDTQGFKSTAVNPTLLNQAYGVSLTVDPNPASEWAAFDYTLPETAGKGVIKISDATGKFVKVVEVSGAQGQYMWDTREVNPGIYFYTFVVNGTGNTAKLVITK